MDGILNIYKEKGYTSHDVVACLRGILKQKKIGHTGTLDPYATGVLPVCLGKATKTCEFLTDKDKIYRSTVRLGITTDTQDMTGNILEERPVQISQKELEQVLLRFTGKMSQVPPMYSAIKVNGKKLYELARQGKTVERKSRDIEIYECSLLNTKLEYNEFEIRVHCSKGTYIRTLCHDIGQALGMGASMKELVRERSGRFLIEDAYTLEQIEKMTELERERICYPIENIFEDYRKIQVPEQAQKRLMNGNLIPWEMLNEHWIEPEEKIRVFDSNGYFKAIYRNDINEEGIRPVKMF